MSEILSIIDALNSVEREILILLLSFAGLGLAGFCIYVVHSNNMRTK